MSIKATLFKTPLFLLLALALASCSGHKTAENEEVPALDGETSNLDSSATTDDAPLVVDESTPNLDVNSESGASIVDADSPSIHSAPITENSEEIQYTSTEMSAAKTEDLTPDAFSAEENPAPAPKRARTKRHKERSFSDAPKLAQHKPKPKKVIDSDPSPEVTAESGQAITDVPNEQPVSPPAQAQNTEAMEQAALANQPEFAATPIATPPQIQNTEPVSPEQETKGYLRYAVIGALVGLVALWFSRRNKSG